MNGYFDPEKYGRVSKVSESYTRIQNEIIDTYMGELSGNAFKCLNVILRFTTGYNRTKAQIATTVFQDLCKIKRIETIYACIREIEQIGLIKVERKTGVTNTFILLQNQSQKTVVANNRTTTEKPQGTTTEKPQGTTTEKPYTIKETIKENFKDNTSCVFEFWKTTFGKTDQVKLSPKRKSKIQARLKSGYTVEDLKNAILGCSLSEYHMGKNDTGTIYDDIELICREPEKTDAFIAKYKKLNPQSTEQKPQAQARVITRDQLEDL